MPTYRYRIVNVFAQETFGGNPLAVFDQADGLDDVQMQQIAQQLNLSETTFVFAPDRDSAADAKVRIFTPGYELPFAGHPTLAQHGPSRNPARTTPSSSAEVRRYPG